MLSGIVWLRLADDDAKAAQENLREAKEELGKKVREARRAARITQQELGAALHVSHVFISNCERGKKAWPTPLLLAAAEHLRILTRFDGE